MEVAFWVGDVPRVIGNGDILQAFFSTVSYHLEPEGWGSRYPELMFRLYNGLLPTVAITKVYNDILDIQIKLKNFSPDQVIWDIDHPDNHNSFDIVVQHKSSDISTYFITSSGQDFITILIESLREASERQEPLYIAPAPHIAYHPPQPSWLQTQRDVTASLPKDFLQQRSFINNREVPYGTPGSIRPDNYRPGGFFKPPIVVDVKNYFLGDPAAYTRLIRETLKGIRERASHLPKTPQKIIIDLRGQHPDQQMLDDLARRLVEDSSGIIHTDDIQFLR